MLESTEDRLSLMKVELEILLSMKIEDGLSFEKAVQVVMVQTGNDYLFSFPPERFPVTCHQVSCVCLRDEESTSYSYIYQEIEDGEAEFAESSELDEDFLNFADSFAGVMAKLRDIAPTHQRPNTAH